jgi:Zn-dependent metalloprotease
MEHKCGINCIITPHMMEEIKAKGDKAQLGFALHAEKVANSERNLRESFNLNAQDSSGEQGILQGVVGSASTGGLNRVIYDAQNRSSRPGVLVRKEISPEHSDLDVNNVYDRLGSTYNLFKDIYSRDSLDGKGLPLIATVNYRTGYSNAFWNGTQMVFGDGDAKLFKDFTGITIVAHELTHGIVQYSGGLDYKNQSGALNESCADIFGALTDQYQKKQEAKDASWLVGEGLFGPSVNGVSLRSMIEPGNAYNDSVLGKDPQPYHMRGYVRTTSDNGGVHINSGIPNHAFYLLSMLLGGNAWEKAGAIWYDTLQKNTNRSIGFRAWAVMTVASAVSLFGSGSREERLVKHAWRLVGLSVDRSGRNERRSKRKKK